MNEDNDYEQERLKNIRENERLMKELGVMGGSSAIGGPPPKRATPSKPRKPATPKSKSDSTPTRIMPTRSSARLAGHEADSETLKRKYEKEAEEAQRAADAAKRARHQQFDLSGMTGGELEEEAILALEATLSSLASNAASAAELVDIKHENKRRATKQEDDQHSADRTELEHILNKMTLKSAAKVTPRRIYSMAYHPAIDKDLIFVGDKEGAIGVWDAAPVASSSTNGVKTEDDEDAAEDDTFPEGTAWTLQVHGRSPVTCIKFDPVNHNSAFSSSYDSTVRKLDLATGKSDEVWAGEEDVLLSIFDILSPSTHAGAYIDTPHPSLDERSMWIADHRGGLLHIDLREKTRRGNNTRRWQVCEKKIGAMSLNRAAPHCVATASLDQHIRLFDVRALASVVKETAEAPYNYKGVDADDLEAAQSKAQFAANKARQACTSVDFSPRGDQLVGVSYDDVVKVWSMDPGWLYSEHGLKNKAAITGAVNGAAKGARRGGAGVKKEEAEPKKGALSTWLSSFNPLKTEEEVKEAIQTAKATAPAKDRPQDVLEDPVRIPHNNQTGKWLTMFRAKWNANPTLEPHFSIGSMTRRAEIYAADGTLLRTLWDENLVTAVPAVTAMHPTRPARLVTGNASGRCTFWSPDQ
ncbi:WD40 repeat-like protein [Moesziomyces antarcticus]|uniref:DNA damage-binding protein CMR1 n=1 Tax=Pseudozyma antarctica TaxID=84753 RepID=A0A5C3FDJ8_PSEA2|nr:WD40 repeat-like protein [Moesziomyces antarcticus]GAK61973.1 WD40 repeat-like protein [Moesziomyces antarcticus]SPO42494.1 probable WD repeat-containing protein UM00675 [Moesziomyces antarcticus]